MTAYPWEIVNMRNHNLILLYAMLLALGVSAGSAAAQIRVAPHLSWGEDHDLAVGGRLLINLSRLTSARPDAGLTSKIDFVLPFDWFFDCTDCTYLEVTPGVILPLTIKNAGPYLGAGVNIARLSRNTTGQDQSNIDLGLGLMGGLYLPVKSVSTFAEVRFTSGGAKQTVVTVGLLLGRGRGR